MYYYREYSPAIQLSPWVKNYWTADGFVESDVATKVFPDGCTDIMFIFDRAKGICYPCMFGTMTTFVHSDFPAMTQIFGIRFQPAGITAFTRVPVDELTDRNVELLLVETLFDKYFCEALAEKQSLAEMVSNTNHHLISLLPSLYGSDKQIIRAVDLIYLAKGQLSLTAVSADVCLCQRHFDRKFKSAVGISPKMFAKIFRFRHALRCLKNYPHKDLLTIATACGYYDHSHLTKDFKTLSGDAPTGFRP
ncbi:MAG: helix-turn-helix domain-containing protein [Bacteroidales bacterium]|jgi:AraC-like DNA-binding protein|nr:helix-turn-helix domain-containing protein [Bacteroidales bacterium]